MGASLYRGLHIFFAAGASLLFLPTILLAWDMNSTLWQISIAAFMANVAGVITLSLLDALFQASKTFAPATMLTFASLSFGVAVGLNLGGVLVDFWYLAAIPAGLALLAGIISGSTSNSSSH